MTRRWTGATAAVALVVLLTTPTTAVYMPQQALIDEIVAGGDAYPFDNGPDAVLTPDGSTLVFSGDLATVGTAELFSVALDGVSVAQRLHPPSNLTTFFELHPDGERVVFVSGHEGRRALYVTRVDGTEDPTRLGPLTETSRTGGFRITPDGDRVVFVHQPSDAVGDSLQIVDVDGVSDPDVLLGAGAVSREIRSLTLTPDGTRAVFMMDQQVDNDFDLWTTRLDGTVGAARLNPEPAASGERGIFTFRVAPDSRHVVYLGDNLETDRLDIFSSTIDASEIGVRLDANDRAGGRASFPEFLDGGTTVVYLSTLRTADSEVTVAEVGVASSSTPVHDPVPGGVFNPGQVSPDGEYYVWQGDMGPGGATELRSLPGDLSGPAETLSVARPGGGDIDVGRTTISPDGEWVAFTADSDPSTGSDDLYVAPLDGSSPTVRVSTSSRSFSRVSLFTWSPDASQLAFTGDLRFENTNELFLVDADGEGQRRLSRDPERTGGVSWPVFSPDSRRIVAFSSLVSTPTDVVSYPLEGGLDPVVISTREDDNGRPSSFFDVVFAPDASFVVYAGDFRDFTRDEYFASGVGQLAPLHVENVVHRDVAARSAVVDWDPPTGIDQVTGYEVTIDPPVVGRRRIAVDADTTTVELTGLAEGTEHTVTVAARNDAGVGPERSTTFTTPFAEAAGLVRLAGDDRYATAAAVALDRFDPDDVDTVYVATGTNFPDALAGGPLAARVGAPILLVEPTRLPDVTRDAIATLDPDVVVALGGEVAVSNDVLTTAGAAGSATTSRLAGDDRYATAAATADALVAAGGDASRAFLAIGTNFPDAVAGGPATDGAPILLTAGTSLPVATSAWFGANEPGEVVALGGEAVLTRDVLADAATAAGGADTDRLSGENRYATATAIAATVDDPTTAYVAVGTNFPDALTGGPAAAAEGAPIVLVAGRSDTVPDETRTYLASLPALRRIVVLGGETVITPAAAAELTALLE